VKDENLPDHVLNRHKGPHRISERKLLANRENAKKSTGPRTVRGKAYSRGNTVKHGLFARELFPLMRLKTESGQEFRDHCERLRKAYKAVGSAEELEVERIAICMWRLSRAWRYENAEINKGTVDVYYQELPSYTTFSDRELETQLQREPETSDDSDVPLDDADEEISAGNGIPDFKEWLAAARVPNRSLAEFLAKCQIAAHPDLLQSYPRDRDLVIAYLTATAAKDLRDLPEMVPFSKQLRVACEQQAVPNMHVVDKVLRYEAATEHSLAPALDRLERLRRRRAGEAVQPTLNLTLRRA
jgi:hypothetical protein